MATTPAPEEFPPATPDAARAARLIEDARGAERIRRALHRAPVVVFTHDADLRYTWVDKPGLGFTSIDQILGRTDRELLGPGDGGRMTAVKLAALRSGEFQRAEITLGVDDERHVVDLLVDPLTDGAGRVTGLTGMTIEITAQQPTAHLLREPAQRFRLAGTRAEEELREAQERFRSAFDEAPIAMALIGARPGTDGRFLRVNRAMCAITGYSEAELLRRGFESITEPEDLCGERELLDRLLDGDIPSYRVEQRYRHAAGHPVWVQVTASLVRNGAGRPLHRITQVEDVGRRRAFESRLRDLADHDALTGLDNRRRFLERLVEEAGRVGRGAGEAAVLMLDIDDFKDVNDTYGHAAGDEILKAVADELTARARDTDTVARIGGDEFGVLLPGAGPDEGAAVAGELAARIRGREVIVAGHALRVTASVGVALLNATVGGRSADEVLVDADLAMYEAKEQGRGRVSVLAPDQVADARVRARMGWAQRIRRALEEDRLDLDVQPVRDLRAAGGPAVQHELLLRMRGESGEPIDPAAVLTIAERFGMAQAIDSWVAGRAIRLLAANPRLRLEMNVTGASLADLGLVRLVERELAAAAVDPARLILEASERSAMDGGVAARHFAEESRARGLGFALDDFGSGVASFTHLNRVPFDYLKIDGDLVSDLPVGATDRLVVSSVVAIAHGLGAKVIAESISSAEGLAFVREAGADLAQGFHLGRPSAAGDTWAAG